MNCPHPKSLQALLDETLSAEEQPTVQAHLDTCERCQKVLEHLAAGGATWDKTAENLTPQPARDETELFRVVEKLQESATNAEQTRAESVTVPPDVDLSFLQPSQRPGSLGRLDEFEILSVVGKGGFGVVLKAFDETLHRIVAIKVLAPQMAASGPARLRFNREAKAAAPINHENVVTIHKVSPADAKFPYLAMQFVAGATLNEKIDKVGQLSVKEILRIGTQIADGLAAAHKQGVVHRDIKPGNILLENGVERVKITDFGLARAADDASVTQSGTVAGTPMYMSPEQANGEPIDLRSDLFSLGSVLYVMCAGKAPFRASSTMAVMKRVCDETPRTIQESNPDIPVWLSDIVAKLHAKKPEDRFQTAKEVAEVLGQHLADMQAGRAGSVSDRSAGPAAIDAPTPVADAPGSPKPRRRRWALAASIVALAGLFFAVDFATNFFGLARWGIRDDATKNVAKNDLGPPVVPVADQEGWVQLFNGKDLTGWKTHPTQPGDWKVENGNLVGSGKRSHLFSERGDFDNFHLRFEAKLNAGGNSGVFIRAPFGLPFRAAFGSLPGGYEADFRANETTVTAGVLAYAGAKPSLTVVTIPTETWFSEEIIAQDERVILKVNGVTTSDFRDPKRSFTKGHIALQFLENPGAVVQFRKIEIKELPAVSPPIAEPGWVQLFNGKDLTGWKYHPSLVGAWKVEDGLLKSAGPTSFLFSERSDFTNFHLRAEVMINAEGDSGIYLRTPFKILTVTAGGKSFKRPSGHEVQIFGGNGPYNTGSLRGKKQIKVKDSFTAPGEWFTLEVIAQGNRIIFIVNGITTVDYMEESGYSQGHIALQQFPAETVVQFRKIEIKELPPAQGRHVKDIAGLDKAVARVNESFDDPAKSCFGWGGWAAHFKDGKILLGDGRQASWGDKSLHFDGNFMCEATATVTAGQQYGWGLALIDSTREKEKALKGVEILLSSSGELRVLPSRFVVDEALKITPIGPIPLTNFKKGERNAVAVIVRGGKSLEIFVNGVQACEPVLLKDALTPAHVQLASAGGAKDSILAFESFKVWSLPPSPEEPGWAQLFNGMDLTGWKSSSPNAWKVEDGQLVASAASAPLRTDRSDFANFRVRMEAKYTAPDGGGIDLRSLRPEKGPTGWYRVGFGKVKPFAPGSISVMGVGRKASTAPAKVGLVQPDQWFTLEVVADGNRLKTFLDGKPAAIFVDADIRQGALEIWSNKPGAFRVKKIEIKELPLTPPPPAEQWVPLFNGKDLTGWKTLTSPVKASWEVVGDVLIGKGGFLMLHTARGDFENFKLRAEVKVKKGSVYLAARMPTPGFDVGYGLQSSHTDGGKIATGLTLFRKGSALALAAGTQPNNPDEWCKLEIIAEGTRLRTFVNGQLDHEYIDTKNTYPRGHVGLRLGQLYNEVQIRKVEIMGLPPDASPRRLQNRLGMEFAVVPKGKAWHGGGAGKEGTVQADIKDAYECRVTGRFPRSPSERHMDMGLRVSRNPVGFDGIAGFRFLNRLTYGNFGDLNLFGLES